MKRVYIDGYAEIADIMYQDACNGRETTFVGLYDDVAEVLREICKFDDVAIVSVNLHPEDYDGYDKEYYVTLDNEFAVWCCEAFDDMYKKYRFDFADTALIADDCNSKVINALDVDEMYEVSFDLGEDESLMDCDGDCDHCNVLDDNYSDHAEETRVAVDNDGKIRGFEKKWTSNDGDMHYYSTYTYFSNNQDLLKRMMDNFDIKH